MSERICVIAAVLAVAALAAACGAPQEAGSKVAAETSAAPAPLVAENELPAVGVTTKDGDVIEAAVGARVIIRLEHPRDNGWKSNDTGAPELRATRVAFESGIGDTAVMVWSYDAIAAGESRIRYFRTEGTNGPEIESRSITIRVN
jgi:hypothetical protein